MKKALSFFILAITLTFPLAAFALDTTSPFTDVPYTSPYFVAITTLKNKGVISGYADGTFKPDQAVNRVEALKMILLGSQYQLPAGTAENIPTFSDIDKSQWYMPYLTDAVRGGIVSGYPDNTFKPTQTVNLVESLKMVILTNKVDLSNITYTGAPYADTPLDQWYAPYVQYAKNLNLIDADSQNKVYPDQPMTRGKLADLMYRQLEINILNNPNSSSSTTTTNNNTTTTNQNTNSNDVVYQINIKNLSYTPSNLLVPIGTTVKWTNNDSVTHNVTFDNVTLASSPNINADGGTFQETFNQEGTFTYHCTIHPSMTGTITVKPTDQVPTI